MNTMIPSTPEEAGTAHNGDIGGHILHHVQNSNEWNLYFTKLHLPQFEPVNILGISIDFSITNHVIMIWIASLFLILLFGLSFSRRKLVPTGFAAILEMLVLFIRDDVAVANLGQKDGRKFTPLLGTFFFFVLTCNLMGLIPLFSTPTGNINLTAALAVITFFTGQAYGIRQNGLWKHIKSLVPGGVPVYLLPLMFIIEVMGLLAKHFALIVRLFANMIAGHIVFFAFLGLIIIFKSIWISPLSVSFGVFVDLLEILVSFIQAYVFTILSALFIGMAIHPNH